MSRNFFRDKGYPDNQDDVRVLNDGSLPYTLEADLPEIQKTSLVKMGGMTGVVMLDKNSQKPLYTVYQKGKCFLPKSKPEEEIPLGSAVFFKEHKKCDTYLIGKVTAKKPDAKEETAIVGWCYETSSQNDSHVRVVLKPEYYRV